MGSEREVGPGQTAARDDHFSLVLVRHGESDWNRKNLFTGWTDIELTEAGRLQARRAGNLLKSHGYTFDIVFTSLLKRAVHTMWHVLDAMDLAHLPDIKTWRLNERHYGALQGLNKQETAEEYGEEQVHTWRRSFATRPPTLHYDDPRHPRFEKRYRMTQPSPPPSRPRGGAAGLTDLAPASSLESGEESIRSPDQVETECLKDCIQRTLPYWHDVIAPLVQQGRNVVVVAHGNSLRGIVKLLEGISDEDIMGVEIPVGTPLVYHLDKTSLKPLSHFYLGEPQVIRPPGTEGDNNPAGLGSVAQTSTFGLMTPCSPSLGAWIRELREVGLAKDGGIFQVTGHPPPASSTDIMCRGADGQSSACNGPVGRGMRHAAGEQLADITLPIDSIRAALPHCSFAVVDISAVALRVAGLGGQKADMGDEGEAASKGKVPGSTKQDQVVQPSRQDSECDHLIESVRHLLSELANSLDSSQHTLLLWSLPDPSHSIAPKSKTEGVQGEEVGRGFGENGEGKLAEGGVARGVGSQGGEKSEEGLQGVMEWVVCDILDVVTRCHPDLKVIQISAARTTMHGGMGPMQSQHMEDQKSKCGSVKEGGADGLVRGLAEGKGKGQEVGVEVVVGGESDSVSEEDVWRVELMLQMAGWKVQSRKHAGQIAQDSHSQ